MNDLSALASLLKSYGATGAALHGRRLHSYLAEHALDRFAHLGNFLIEMYGLCSCFHDARSVFDRLVNPNIVSWNILIKSYSHNRCLSQACDVFHRMPHRDIVSWNAILSALHRECFDSRALQASKDMLLQCQFPDKVTAICILNVCACLGAVKEGQNLHVIILQNNFEKDVVVGTAIVNFYGSCNCLDSAMSVFDQLLHHDIISWNALISAFLKTGGEYEALDLFYRMKKHGFKPNRVTFICVLSACGNLGAREENDKILDEAMKIHLFVIEDRLEQDVGISTALLTMYGKCGRLLDAASILLTLSCKNVVSWNAMIGAFSVNGRCHEAFALFSQMIHEENMQPDKVSFLCSLDACSSLELLEEGRILHSTIIQSGSDDNVEVVNKLISMYGRCGSVTDAQITFDKLIHKDTVSWNSMISVYVQNGYLEPACDLFSRLKERDVASWNTMIAAYSGDGRSREALGLFEKLFCTFLEPTEVSFLGALDACSSLADQVSGGLVHNALVCAKLNENHVLANALINMYGKCGSLYDALNVFNKKDYRDIVSWNAIIGAAALNGHGDDALKLLSQMQLQGTIPNAITVTCILFACDFTGCVEEGKHVFLTMNEFGIICSFDHYVCMIDLICRAGHIDEAECLIKTIPFVEVDTAWFCLLGACNIHNDMERAVEAANYCFQTDTQCCSPYVLLSNMYVSLGRQHELSDNVIPAVFSTL